MTRESKLALIIGFVLVLVVGVLVSDHFSQANSMELDTQEASGQIANGPITELGIREQRGLNRAIESASPKRQIASSQSGQDAPVEIFNGRRATSSSQSRDQGSILDRAFNHVQETEFPKAAQVTPKQTSSFARSLPEVSYPKYRVVEGDSLIKIARRLLGDGDRWTEIHQLNAAVLGPDAILKIGVYLKLPSDAKGDAKNDAKKTTTRRASSTASSVKSYTVISGDTLGQISMKLLGTSRRADEIAELNGLESANDIRIGMKLKIPSK